MGAWVDYQNGVPFTVQGEYCHKLHQIPYHIEDGEIDEIDKFIQSTELPFKDEVLELSRLSFDQALFIPNRALRLISNLIALEALLNPGKAEVRYRVSRNLAVLLGSGQEDSIEIFEKMKKLYDTRSKIVHGNKIFNIKEDEVKLSERFAREAIKKFYSSGLNKVDLLKRINSMGFNSNRNW